MTPHKIMTGLIAVIFLQLAVLAGVYLNSVYPIWTGKTIMLKTVPIDPRSLFRGNYARLRYDISTIPATDVDKFFNPRQGEVVYVKLKSSPNGLMTYNGVSANKPGSGLFLRGRIENPWRSRSGTYRVRYGIEAYFAPKKKALQLEKKLRKNGVAKIKVTGNGKAALLEVIDGPAQLRGKT